MSLPVLPALTPLTGAPAGEWAGAILEALDAPVNDANVYSFAGWFREEGGGGENNPMNSSQGDYPDTPGDWNVDHVKNYPTPEIGVTETVATLKNGYYPAIIAAFRAGLGLEHPSAEAAAELGTWSGGGYHSISPVVVPMPPKPPVKPSGTVKATITWNLATDAFSIRGESGEKVVWGTDKSSRTRTITLEDGGKGAGTWTSKS